MCMYVLSSVLLCFRIKMMFGSSLPPAVCKRAHVLFTFFVFVLCCKLLWIVHLRLSFRYSLTFYDLLEQTFRFFIILTTVISRRKFQWYIASVTFGAQYLTGMVTSVLPYDTFSLIKKTNSHQAKNYKNHLENSNFWGMWPVGHIGHVTYSFINVLFISTGWSDDKLQPQILSVGTTYLPTSVSSTPFQWEPYCLCRTVPLFTVLCTPSTIIYYHE